VIKAWSKVDIIDCLERLSPIPSSIQCLEPHPYVSLGAPYGEGTSPWFLRSGVINRLVYANDYLCREDLNITLGIFDALRPVSVQSFMVEYTIKEECKRRGIDRENNQNKSKVKKIIEEVETYWAMPSLDPALPPPHSTGGAVDLTLLDSQGIQLNMGCDIDCIGAVSTPNYFADSSNDKDQLFNSRRLLLTKVMSKAGFVQHPHEWWHFSFGDQLWAWTMNYSNAIYGGCVDESNSDTF
tara:strand:+ start:6386 stop:7105 length:720 start_codon:yes stop_codon:yes gene_type:complete